MNAHNWWVYLARFYSGMLNAGMLLSVGSMLTLHTGNLTRISIYSILGQWDKILSPLIAMLSYLVGVFFTKAYYGKEKLGMTYRYWQGYALVGTLFLLLWLLPVESLVFIIILSAAMGIIYSMPLPNHGYTGAITMMTGLISELISCLSYWIVHHSDVHKKQTLYLAVNLLFYILGALIQTLLYVQMGVVKAWPLMALAFLLSAWAYHFGEREVIA